MKAGSSTLHYLTPFTLSSSVMAHLGTKPPKSLNCSQDKSKDIIVSSRNINTKRKLSISTVSSVSSLTAMEDGEDEADAEASSDDEDDQPAEYAPSYGNTKSRGRKTGAKTGSTHFAGREMRKLSYDDGYDGQQSNAASGSDGSDDGYGAVDDITDADDEELEVEKLEERLILESEDERQKVGTIPTISDDADIDDLVSLGPFEDRILFSTASFLDEEHLYSALEGFGDTDMPTEAVETPVQRRVHFEDSDPSDSDQTPTGSTDDELPADFLQQDSLDPTLRRMIENDYGTWSNHKPCFDDIFGELDFSPAANIYHAESDAVSDGSSGYETDDGETTDEDLPPPATISHPRSILRRDSTASLASPGDVNQRSVGPRRRGPIMGTFIADPSKPVALVDCTGKHLVIIPAYASSRHDWLEPATNSLCGTANNSSCAATMHLVDESDTDALVSPTGPDQSPMLSSSANLMMTALGNDSASGGQVLGPPEAFYPSRAFMVDSSFEEDEDDDEAMLNVDDFINFGNVSSDEETEKAFDGDLTTSPMVTSTIQGLGTPTPTRSSELHQGNSAERFLNHLDKGIVTAFRRNYNRYQTLIRLPQHREFMPANAPSRTTSVFRHSRYAGSRTPTRKRKASNYAGGEAVRRKLLDGHRRVPLPL